METLYVLGGYFGIFTPIIFLLVQMDKEGPVHNTTKHSSSILSIEKLEIEYEEKVA